MNESIENVASRNPRERQRLLSSGILAIFLVIATELMFFGGLISAYLVKLGAEPYWPPQEHISKNLYLPEVITFWNTIILLLSGLTMQLSFNAIRNPEKEKKTFLWMLLTLGLGIAFFSIQGIEWYNLLSVGLTQQTSLLGAFFYTIIGMHAFHVFVGLIILMVILRQLQNGKYSSSYFEGVSISRLYWFFVTFLWPILYVLVYLIGKSPSAYYLKFNNWYWFIS